MKKYILLLAALCGLVSCGNNKFRTEIDGKKTDIFTLYDGGPLTVEITNFGARVVSMTAPDRNGVQENVVLGHDNIEDYITPKGDRFYGACVGPVANRIGKATFTVDGKEYHTPENDNGNTLHGGFKGLDMVVWDVLSVSDNSLTLAYLHPDGQEGYPGNLKIKITYTVKKNTLLIDYIAKTDAPTPVSIAYHPFFNLKGQDSDTILGHVMQIFADRYEPVDSLLIPLGHFSPVEGTPYDFREPKVIDQLIYDNNWVINKGTPSGTEILCAVYEPEEGRRLEVWSDQPGLQVYSGKNALVLEAQQHPDAVNNPEVFGDIVLRPNQAYTQHTEFRFSTVK
ncbi:MAG: galactose mutarotase [Bacteroidales bacterium]|nr:galactose mutarotase [Bacteroidales bacterium]